MREPPWGPQQGDPDTDRECVRCGEVIPGYWRHYWAPCRNCNIWSLAGQALMACFGLNGHPWLYEGARPWCGDCDGTGYRPCEPQDCSTLRVSGECQSCHTGAFYLTHHEGGGRWERVPDSTKHFDPTLDDDHTADFGGGPLVRVLDDYLTREGGSLGSGTTGEAEGDG